MMTGSRDYLSLNPILPFDFIKSKSGIAVNKVCVFHVAWTFVSSVGSVKSELSSSTL